MMLTVLVATLKVSGAVAGEVEAGDAEAAGEAAAIETLEKFATAHCLDCHDDLSATAELSLQRVDDLAMHDDPLEMIHRDVEVWEKVVRRLRARQMPPTDIPKPDESDYQQAIAALEQLLDSAASQQPRPGRTDTFRRLTRNEYRNAVRDLLALEIDVESLLPPDASSHGFDNVTVGNLSPALMTRYIGAAQKISRLAVGSPRKSPGGDTFRIPADRTQESHVEGLPVGTRGGALIDYTFPQDGSYEIQVRLARDRNEEVEGLHEPHQLDVLLDRELIERFTVRPPGSGGHQMVDAGLKTRFKVLAGMRQVGVTFAAQPQSLLDTRRQPYEAHFNMHRHPRLTPAVYQISITGPYDEGGPGETVSRDRIFICRPKSSAEEDDCAEQIVKRLLRKAYRRPVDDADLQQPMRFFHDARDEDGFEAGIEMALSAILVNPNFLFRIERDPAGLDPGATYAIDEFELASRLSFFLWSSLPDDRLLELAEAGRLSDPDVLEQQVRRMLDDERSASLADNFAGQWLQLRNLDSITPDLRQFPDFDDNLRQAFREETERFFASIVQEDRSVLDLLRADYTYLNERLAKHYNIPHIYGSRFRRVQLNEESQRGGLLRHGSILTVTSYATRTSPVIRGHWILENMLGVAPPPPPPDVPALEDNTVDANLSVRERLAEHRANPNCASCHDLMDPVGFALEHFDAVGRWRELEAGKPVDASGGLPDGSEFEGVEGLQDGLLKRPELFVGTLTEKLMIYALGRGVEPEDAAAIRGIVRQAQADEYRFSSLIVGITQSVPFQMRTAQ